MEFTGIETIKISGLKLLNIGSEIDLTTADYPYNSMPSKNNGGIYFKPILKIENNIDGYFFFSQIATKHKIKTISNRNIEFIFENNKPLKDTVCLKDSFYREAEDKFYVHKSKLTKPIVFWDIPFRQLMDYWLSFDYEIEFETWLQFHDNNTNKIIPIISFTWWLKASAIKINNNWQIISESHSDEDEITKSICTKSIDDNPLVVNDLSHLNTETVKYFKEIMASIQ